MSVRYYRINRAAYTAAELSVITVGLRRLLLPAYVARLYLLKLLGKAVPIGDPIADTHLNSKVDNHEAPEIRKRHVAFQEAESTLPSLGFTDIRYYRTDDPRYPGECYSLYAIESSGSIAAVCTVMSRGQVSVHWIEYLSLLSDRGTLRSSNHALAGVLRPAPSALIVRMPGASSQNLLQFHGDQMERLRSQGSRFVGDMSVDRAVQADRDYYRDQMAHWVKTGLLVPEREKGAG